MMVADAMTPNAQVALPQMDIGDAARLMAELDVGVLPVSDGGALVGIVTDRDIAVRAVALRLGAETPVERVMSTDPRYCHDDDDLDEVMAGMARLRVRRMPVLDRANRLVGIVSLADAGLEAPAKRTGEALLDITEPGGSHSQADDEDPHAVVATSNVADADVPPELAPGPMHFTDDEPG
jgi:CBS domain-containing protein